MFICLIYANLDFHKYPIIYALDICIITGDLVNSVAYKQITSVDSNFQLKFVCSNTSNCAISQLDSDMQMDVMAGMIENFDPASRYISHPEPDKVTCTLVCHIKSRKESLNFRTLTNMDVHLDAEGEKQLGTHVVVGINYGAQFHCAMRKKVRQRVNEDKKVARFGTGEKLSGLTKKMADALEKCQSLEEFQQQLKNENKQFLADVRCRIYAHASQSESGECTFFGAYQHCLDLIEQLKTDGTMAIPIHVYQFPLKGLVKDSELKTFDYRHIDEDLVDRCLRIWTELEKISAEAMLQSFAMKVNSTSTNIFRNSVLAWLRQFSETVVDYQAQLSRNLRKFITNAREVDGNDDNIEKVINTAEQQSVFQPSRLEQLLGEKNYEVKMASKIAAVNGVASGITFLSQRKQLDEELNMDSAKNGLFVLCIPSYDGRTNKYLSAMRSYLQIFEDGDDLVAMDAGVGSDFGECWSQQQQGEILDKIEEFSTLKNRNQKKKVSFCVMLGEAEEECHYEIYNYEAGVLVKKELRLLPNAPTGLQVFQPAPENGKRVIGGFIHLKWNYEDVGIPCLFLVEYQQKGVGDSWITKRLEENHTTIRYRAGVSIEIRVATVFCFGRTDFCSIEYCKYPAKKNFQSRPIISPKPTQKRKRSVSPQIVYLKRPAAPGIELQLPTEEANMDTADNLTTPSANDPLHLPQIPVPRDEDLEGTAVTRIGPQPPTEEENMEVDDSLATPSTKDPLQLTNQTVEDVLVVPNGDTERPAMQGIEPQPPTEVVSVFDGDMDTEHSPTSSIINIQLSSMTNESQENRPAKRFCRPRASQVSLNPEFQTIQPTSAYLSWTPIDVDGNFQYRVKFWKTGGDMSEQVRLFNSSVDKCLLAPLEPGMTYSVNVVAVSEKGEKISNPDECIPLTTPGKKRLALKLVDRCQVVGKKNELNICAISLKKTSGPLADRFVFNAKGHPKNELRKTILLMGATDSEKTTVLNGMMNYILDTQSNDTFRFQLTGEISSSRITIYEIPHIDGMRIDYSLKIVSFPDYGDVKDFENDQKITKKIHEFLKDPSSNDIQQLDAVCFVTRASLQRLTPNHLYVFGSMFSIFGKDFRDHINFFLTFANDQVNFSSICNLQN